MKMIQPLTIEDIKAAIHKWDLISRPYALYYHPNDKEVIQGIMTTPTGDNLSPTETPLIKPGQVLLVDRAKVEDYYKEMFDCFVSYKEIGKEDTYGD
jgi:hypothetical protein